MADDNDPNLSGDVTRALGTVLADVPRDTPLSSVFHTPVGSPSLTAFRPSMVDEGRLATANMARALGHPFPHGVAQREEDAWRAFGMTGLLYGGGENLARAYLQGSPLKALQGLAELGLGAGLGKGMKTMADSMSLKPPAAKVNPYANGPWGNPKYLDQFLETVPFRPRHELNEPVVKPFRPRPYQDLNAEHNALRDEGIGFTLPQEGAKGRWSYNTKDPVPNYEASLGKSDFTRMWENRMHREFGDKKPETPMEALARDVETHGANNENIPGVYERAQALANELRGIESAQKPYRDYNYKVIDNWDKTIGFDHNRNLFKSFEEVNPDLADKYNKIGNYDRHGHRYLDDAEKFAEPSVQSGGTHTIDDIEPILQHQFGADPADPASIERAYKAFWDHEHAQRAAGKMTIHGEDALALKQSNEQFMREHGGREGVEAYLSALRGEAAEAREGAMRHLSGQGDGQRTKDLINNVLRYGPPTTVGAYAASKGLQMLPDPPPRNLDDIKLDLLLPSKVRNLERDYGLRDWKMPPYNKIPERGTPVLPDAPY